MSPPTTSDIGIYLHVPFCERVCPYCDFAVCGVGATLAPEVEARYVSALMAELSLHGGERPLASVYLGGGTPGLLRPESVDTLLAGIETHFGSAPNEVTLELNPGVQECSRLAGFLAAGVTRVSVGVQALDDLVLRRLGRAQKADEARAGLEAVLSAGFDSVSADLIYGAPGQTTEGLLRDLEMLIDLGIPHLSMYALTLEPGTPFERAARQGRLDLPDEACVDTMARLSRSRATAAGLAHYEISSFARPGHRSRHNQRYWEAADVLGLGVSAASLVAGRRFQNPRALDAYLAGIEAGRLPAVESGPVGPAEARREALYLGFRRPEGISRAGFARRHGGPPERWFGAEIAELRSLGLIADEGGHIRLTERGILFGDEVFLRFVDD